MSLFFIWKQISFIQTKTEDYTEWILQEKMSDASRQKISKMFHEKSLQLAEMCAGMASGTQCATVLGKTWKGLFGEQIRLETTLITEQVPWKMEVCKNICQRCDAQPKDVQRTEDEAKEANPVGADIAVVAIECDDVSHCSSTQRSNLDSSGKSGASFLQFLSYLEKLPFEKRPRFIVAECVSALGKMKKKFQERGTTVVCEKILDVGYVGCFHELKTANFSLPQSRSRVYGVFKKLRNFSRMAKETLLKEVDQTLGLKVFFYHNQFLVVTSLKFGHLSRNVNANVLNPWPKLLKEQFLKQTAWIWRLLPKEKRTSNRFLKKHQNGKQPTWTFAKPMKQWFGKLWITPWSNWSRMRVWMSDWQRENWMQVAWRLLCSWKRLVWTRSRKLWWGLVVTPCSSSSSEVAFTHACCLKRSMSTSSTAGLFTTKVCNLQLTTVVSNWQLLATDNCVFIPRTLVRRRILPIGFCHRPFKGLAKLSLICDVRKLSQKPSARPCGECVFPQPFPSDFAWRATRFLTVGLRCQNYRGKSGMLSMDSL